MMILYLGIEYMLIFIFVCYDKLYFWFMMICFGYDDYIFGLMVILHIWVMMF